MSDLSYTRDEDDFPDELDLHKPSKRSYPLNLNHVTKRRRSSKTLEVNNPTDRIIATTTLTLDHQGPLSATSVIETIPSTPRSTQPSTAEHTNYLPSAPPLFDDYGDGDQENEFTPKPPSTLQPFSMNGINTRPHSFLQKAMIIGETCNVCDKRIKFSSMGAKCKECKAIAHVHCKDRVPLPCVPLGCTPSKNAMGSIADYVPHIPPMVPSLVVHCIKEIEERGLKEVGLYRIPGSDKEVKSLKEKFLKGKGVPNLSQIMDIHAICGCLKEFLRSLKEPLITYMRWDKFARAIDIQDTQERRQRLYHIISELPQPNRDTLSYLVLHLQRVAESPDCKMPIGNLSRMFGPSVIGYSGSEPENMFAETTVGNKVMAELLELPSEVWEGFIKEGENKENMGDLPKTPSSNSLLNFLNTPARVKTLKKIKYFETQ